MAARQKLSKNSGLKAKRYQLHVVDFINFFSFVLVDLILIQAKIAAIN